MWIGDPSTSSTLSQEVSQRKGVCTWLQTCPIPPHPLLSGDYGCIVNGQLVLDRTDPVGGNKGVMMKMCIGRFSANIPLHDRSDGSEVLGLIECRS